MMTDRQQQTRIGLLVGAHLLLGLIMAILGAIFPRLRDGMWASIWFVGLISSDILLLGMWAGLSAARWWVKLAGLLSGVGWFECLALAPHPVKTDVLPMLAIVGVPVLIIAGSCALCRCLLARIVYREKWKSRPISEELQFTLRTMIGLTITIATVLAVGRIVRQIDPEIAGFANVVFSLSLTALLGAGMLAWASLGPGRAIVRVPTAIAGAVALGPLVPYYLDGPAHQYLAWPALTALSAFFTAGSLLVIRSCGYRLVRIRADSEATTAKGITIEEVPS